MVYGILLGSVSVDSTLLNDPMRFAEMMKRLTRVQQNAVSGNAATGNGFGGIVLGATANQNSFIHNIADRNGGKVQSEKMDWLNGAGFVSSCGTMKNVFTDNEASQNDNFGIYMNLAFYNVFRPTIQDRAEALEPGLLSDFGERP